MSIITSSHDPFDYYPQALQALKASTPMLINLPEYNSNKDNVFQFDDKFILYRASKLRSKTEDPSAHYQTKAAVNKGPIFEAIIDRMTSEYPDRFKFTNNLLLCKHTGETLRFLGKQIFDPSGSTMAVAYQDGFEALSLQLQEDLVIYYVSKDRGEFVDTAAIHHPGVITADRIIGKPLSDLSQGVTDAHGKLVIRFPAKLSLDLTKSTQPKERVGMVQFCDALVLRNNPRQVVDFNNLSNLLIRFERQVFIGIPSSRCFLMTSKPYFVNLKQNQTTSEKAIQAIQMAGQGAYEKDTLNQHGAQIIEWLQQ
jgi:hypothetical protein